MEKSRLSYIIAAICVVVAAILVAYFMLANPTPKEPYTYGAGALLVVALIALLVGLKFRMKEKEPIKSRAEIDQEKREKGLR